jgi:hypothetical protein
MAIDPLMSLLASHLRDGTSLRGFCGGQVEHLTQWSFTPAFRLWLADYLEAGHPIPDWLTVRAKAAPALPVP